MPQKVKWKQNHITEGIFESSSSGSWNILVGSRKSAVAFKINVLMFVV